MSFFSIDQRVIFAIVTASDNFMANVFLSEEQKKKEEKKKKELKAKKKEEKKKKEEAKKAPIQFNEHLSFLNDIGKQQAIPATSNGKLSFISLFSSVFPL